jgi:hypothetical protein
MRTWRFGGEKMGLDITFFGDDPAAAELDGQRLASVPGFLQFVLALGEILNTLKQDPQDEILYSCYQDCLDYIEKDPESEARFEAYLSFVKECAERVASDGADMAVPLRLDDYDRVARRLSAALMLRDKPITGREAREIAELVSGLLRHSRTMARILNMLSKGDAAAMEHEIEVLERFKRCLDVAAEKNISFRIDF